MRVLLTGARGKVGRAAVRALQRAGHDVTATDLAEPEFDAPPPGTPAYVKADPPAGPVRAGQAVRRAAVRRRGAAQRAARHVDPSDMGAGRRLVRAQPRTAATRPVPAERDRMVLCGRRRPGRGDPAGRRVGPA